MAIKATFPVGTDSVTVASLHQWDYGQQLEIESADLPSTIEVHFACQAMSEAVVRSCGVVNGVATVDIPDLCLEQTTPITAWVYEIVGTRGTTTKTITIPIIHRTRPSRVEDVPQKVADRYTELIDAVNTAMADLASGDVVPAKAREAEHATRADSATNATNAVNATQAGNANNASRAATADRAIADEHGNNIYTSYVRQPSGDYFKADYTSYNPAVFNSGSSWYFGGVGKTASLRVLMNNRYIDLGIVVIPNEKTEVDLPVVVVDALIGDGSAYGTSLALPRMIVDPESTGGPNGTVHFGFARLTGNAQNLSTETLAIRNYTLYVRYLA